MLAAANINFQVLPLTPPSVCKCESVTHVTVKLRTVTATPYFTLGTHTLNHARERKK